jgi:hypothetical protein
LEFGEVVCEVTISLADVPEYPPGCTHSIGIFKGSIKDFVKPVHGLQINALIVTICKELIGCYNFQAREYIEKLGLKGREPVRVFKEFNLHLLLE